MLSALLALAYILHNSHSFTALYSHLSRVLFEGKSTNFVSLTWL
jgi:hypothetical protein